MRYFLTEDSEQVVGEFWRRLFQALSLDVEVICTNGNKNMARVLREHLDDLLVAETAWIQLDIRDDRLIDERYRNTCQFLVSLSRVNPGVKRLEIMCFEEFLLSFERLLDWCCCDEPGKRELAAHVRQCLEEDIYYDDDSELLLAVKKRYRPRNQEKLAKALYRYFTDRTPFERSLLCYVEDCCHSDIVQPRCAPDSKVGVEKLLVLYRQSLLHRLVAIPQ